MHINWTSTAARRGPGIEKEFTDGLLVSVVNPGGYAVGTPYRASLRDCTMFEGALPYLPERVASALEACDIRLKASASEIRLRAGGPVSLTAGDTNIFVDSDGSPVEMRAGICAASEELERCVLSLCDGSYHSQFDNIRSGFISCGPYRAGVCGEGWSGGAQGVASVESVSAVSIRIPRFVADAASPLLERWRERGMCSALICSPPCGGKTTALRSLCRFAARGAEGFSPVRTALVDSRREVYLPEFMGGGLLDVLDGYPKAWGMELAVRTLSPQLIVCDELGGDADARAVLEACSCGVHVVATVHAASPAQLACKPWFAELTRAGVFGAYCVIGREGGRYWMEVGESQITTDR